MNAATRLTRDAVLSAIELLPCIAEGLLRYELLDLIEAAEANGIDPTPLCQELARRQR